MSDAKWVRPAFLSLVGLFGLVLLTTGLMRGAMAGFHIAEPRYGVADSRVDRIADAITLQSQILVQSLALAGNAPPGFDQVVRDELARMRRHAVQAVKDEAYDDAVQGALQFVLGGFIFLIGAGSAKRSARRLEGAPAGAPSGPGSSPFAPGSRGPTVAAESPVGRLQEAPPRTLPPSSRAPEPARPAKPGPAPAPPKAPPSSPPRSTGPVPVMPEDPKRPTTRKTPAPKRPATSAAPPPSPRPVAVPRPAPEAPKAAPDSGPVPSRPVPPAPSVAPATERPAPPAPARPATPPLASPPRPRPAAPTSASPPAPPFRPAPLPDTKPGEEQTEP